MKKVLAVVFGVVLVAAACNNKAPEQTNNQPTAPTNSDPEAVPDVVVDSSVNPRIEITMTANGYTPSSITVKKGTTVHFVNADTKSRWPASAPHPTHTIYSEFDPKAAVGVGKTWSFKFDKVGEWKFHDHLTPTMFGSVTVTE